MKKWISVLTVVSLVASLAFAMNGCGKGKDDPPAQTTEAVTESTAEVSTKNDSADDFQGFLEELESEREEQSLAEYTTNEHFQDELDALTIPASKPAAGTAAKQASAQTGVAEITQAVHRETTTEFKFTAPVRTTSAAKASTTAKAGETAKADAAASTTKAAEKTTEATTAAANLESPMVDYIGDSHVVHSSDVTVEPMPQATYKYKHLIMPLTSGSFTAKLQNQEVKIPVTIYYSQDNLAVAGNIGKLLLNLGEDVTLPSFFEKLGTGRLVVTNKKSSPRFYLVFATRYYDLTDMEVGKDENGNVERLGDHSEEFFAMIDEMLADLQKYANSDGMEYCGVKMGNGYTVESYRDATSNTLTSYYFTANGLSKIETVDLSTDQVVETVLIELQAGVKDSSAFKITGIKRSTDELAQLFDNLAG